MRYYHKTQNHAVTFVAIGLVIVAAFMAFDYVNGNRAGAQNTPLVSDTPAGVPKAIIDVEQEALLKKIEAIKLDGSILKDQAFLSLTDWTAPLGEEEVGKVNPFAPLGGARPATTNTTRR